MLNLVTELQETITDWKSGKQEVIGDFCVLKRKEGMQKVSILPRSADFLTPWETEISF